MTNKRIVKIKRVALEDTKPKELYDNAKWRIGATLSASSRTTNTGLTPEEEEKYMPSILGMSVTDPSFRNAVKEYFAEMTVDIPAVTGRSFDLTLKEDGTPENLSDFLQYRFALCDPRVCRDGEAQTALGHMYYVEDEQKIAISRYSQTQLRKEAFKAFVNLCADEDKFRMAFRILAKGDSDELGVELAEPMLEEIMSRNPQEFLDTVKDRKLEMKFLIANGIALNILRQEGTAVLFHDETLGYTEDEAVLFLENPENSTILATLKARIQAAKGTISDSKRLQEKERENQKEHDDESRSTKSGKRQSKSKEASEEEQAAIDLDFIDKGAG